MTQNEGPVMHLVPLMQLRPLNKSLNFTFGIKVEFYLWNKGGISEAGVWVSPECHAKPHWNLSQKEKSVTLILSLKKCIVFIMDFLALILFV